VLGDLLLDRLLELDLGRCQRGWSHDLIVPRRAEGRDLRAALRRDDTPFRDAYERVSGSVRSGSSIPSAAPRERVAARGAPGPGGVQEALAAARARFAKT
jgi:hypothetical protein